MRLVLYIQVLLLFLNFCLSDLENKKLNRNRQLNLLMWLISYGHISLLLLNSFGSGLWMIYTHTPIMLHRLQIIYDWSLISSSHLTKITNVILLANITYTIACNNSLRVLAYICILPNSKFLGEKKILDIGLYYSVNE